MSTVAKDAGGGGGAPAPAALTTVLAEGAGGMWAWLFQRITAVLLLFGLVVHLTATHIFAIGDLDFANITDRLGHTFFLVTDVVVLGAGLYHALNGGRMVVLDYWLPSAHGRRWLGIWLWVVGVVMFVYGLWALWPWISG